MTAEPRSIRWGDVFPGALVGWMPRHFAEPHASRRITGIGLITRVYDGRRYFNVLWGDDPHYRKVWECEDLHPAMVLLAPREPWP